MPIGVFLQYAGNMRAMNLPPSAWLTPQRPLARVPLFMYRLLSALRFARMSLAAALTALTSGCIMLTGDFELLEEEACPVPFACSAAGELQACTIVGGTQRLEPIDECGSANLCDRVSGTCMECVPHSQRRCNEDVLERCNADGRGWEVETDCSGQGLVCAENEASGTVVARCAVCQRGERICDEREEAVLGCELTNEGWAFFEDERCEHFGCMSGSSDGLRNAWCKVCDTPNRSYCVSSGDSPSTELRTCNEQFRLFARHCEAGEHCVTQPNGSAQCVPLEN